MSLAAVAVVAVEDCLLLGVGVLDTAVANDLLDVADRDEIDRPDIGTKGDAAILILLGFDAGADVAVDVDDFTFGVGAGVVALATGVATGVGVLLGLVDFELEIFGMDGTLEAFELDVSILLKAGAALALALVLVDGGPDTSENDDILKFTGVGVFLTSGEGDGAGVAL